MLTIVGPIVYVYWFVSKKKVFKNKNDEVVKPSILSERY